MILEVSAGFLDFLTILHFQFPLHPFQFQPPKLLRFNPIHTGYKPCSLVLNESASPAGAAQLPCRKWPMYGGALPPKMQMFHSFLYVCQCLSEGGMVCQCL